MDLAAAGSWASIAGLPVSLVSLAISVYVALTLRRLRRRILVQVQAESLIQDLGRSIESISDQLDQYPNVDRQLLIAIRLAVVLVSRVQDALGKDGRDSALAISRVALEIRKAHSLAGFSNEVKDKIWTLLEELIA
ncbi:MAG: hypothetical protein GVY13_07175, partial [Alphaproteobacteria bacterium]|nr:hypothetical protein [Alphaproteobacteria bacterium]